MRRKRVVVSHEEYSELGRLRDTVQFFPWRDFADVTNSSSRTHNGNAGKPKVAYKIKLITIDAMHRKTQATFLVNTYLDVNQKI